MDLIIAPLPARKKLWEACDVSTWKEESQREPGIQVAFGLAADGEILRLEQGRLSCTHAILPGSHQSLDSKATSQGTGGWEEWCSGIDAFGGLVLLAASLIA